MTDEHAFPDPLPFELTGREDIGKYPEPLPTQSSIKRSPPKAEPKGIKFDVVGIPDPPPYAWYNDPLDRVLWTVFWVVWTGALIALAIVILIALVRGA